MPGIFLVLAGLGDLALALAVPAALFQTAALHELCHGHAPPSTLFALAFTLEQVFAAAVAPALVAALGRLSRRWAVVLGTLAEASFFVGLLVAGRVLQPGSSFWPLVLLQAAKGCTQRLFQTALNLLKYDFAEQMSAAAGAQEGGAATLTVQQAAAKLTSDRMAIEATVALCAAAVYRGLSPELALVVTLAINAAQVCAAMVFIASSTPALSDAAEQLEQTEKKETGGKDDGGRKDQPGGGNSSSEGLSSWQAFIAIYNVPLERIHLLQGIWCIGAAPQLARKLQFGCGGSAADLAAMTCIGKLTYIVTSVFDLVPRAQKTFGTRAILVAEPLGHSIALLMSVGPWTTVPLLFCADIIKWGSLCVGDPVEETYRMTEMQRRGVGVADWMATHQRFNGVHQLFKPALVAWLWSVHIDAPSLFSAVSIQDS